MQENWLEMIDEAFGFLQSEHNYSRVDWLNDPGKGAYAIYQNGPLRIIVEYERYSRECSVYFEMYERESCISLNDLRAFAGGQRENVLQAEDPNDVANAMQKLAHDCRQYAGPLICGDVLFVKELRGPTAGN